MQLFTGVFLGILIGLAAWRAGALSGSGALAASATGAAIFGLGGFPWAVVLLLFFVSSSALSKAFAKRKTSLADNFAKGSRRDWGQVFANGGLGVLLVFSQVLFPGEMLPWVAFAGAMAAVNADTWATELGVLDPSPPRLITGGRRVEKGTSGAISWVGSLAALAGALLIGAGASLFTSGSLVLPLLVSVAAGGLAGSFLDSFLGATVQGIYWCPACLKETERHPQHACGSPTTLRRGFRWLGNDLVNFSCSIAGAITAAGVWLLLG
jgi:uncharacterized protein (TIGR00297 family)